METNKGDHSNKLFLFTTAFPYGKGETFLKDELQILKNHFDEILIFPLPNNAVIQYRLPGNVKTADIFGKKKYKGSEILLRNLFLFLRIFISEFFSEKNKKGFLKRRKYLRSNLLQCLHAAELLEQYLGNRKNEKNGRIIYYSYWMHDWVTVLSLMKQRNKNFEFSTRIHGFDLYHERHENGIIPFRNFQLKNVKKVFAVSNDGKKYLEQNFPQYKIRFLLSHLGVFDKGKNPLPANDQVNIVSCSNCNAVKRVRLIAEALKYCRSKIQWIHFGDGEEMERIKEVVSEQPANIKSVLRGRVENEVITEYYRNTPVNLFIHVSSTEGGVPVAIQEAMSFGIPVIAVAVGGVVDIVNEKTGLLLDDKNISPEKISAEIEKALTGEINSPAFRDNVRTEWEKEFSATKNYGLFCHQLKSDKADVV